MSSPRRVASSGRVRRRRATAVICVVAVAGIAISAARVLGVGPEHRAVQGRGEVAVIRVEQRGRTLLSAPVARVARLSPAQLDAWLGAVPVGRELRRGRATIELKTDRAQLAADVVRAASAGGGHVTVPERAIASRISLDPVAQALRNNCETAALQMLLAANGVRAPQLGLQRALLRSGPLDPVRRQGQLPLWGDPDLGFVGRADGTGTDGGFGVYEAPIMALALRRGVPLQRLSGTDPRVVYRALLQGRPVMAWVGLSAGPLRSWRTPSGRTIRVNFGEHTVVLTGLAGNSITLNDPLSGKALVWTRADFETLWTTLGRRAVAPARVAP